MYFGTFIIFLLQFFAKTSCSCSTKRFFTWSSTWNWFRIFIDAETESEIIFQGPMLLSIYLEVFQKLILSLIICDIKSIYTWNQSSLVC